MVAERSQTPGRAGAQRGAVPAEAVDNARLYERSVRAEERYRSLIAATGETIWTTDAEGQMRGAQDGWERLTGQRREEYQGTGWFAALHPEDRASALEAWQRALSSRSLFESEHRVRVASGAWRHFSVRAVPVLESQGQLREWVGVHTDVTARKTAELERERLIAALGRINADLDQFAYVASHDLKAPLRGIANLSEWIEEDLADVMRQDTREQMALLRGRVHRLEALIDGILSYSRAGRTRADAVAVDVRALLHEVIELLAPPEQVQIVLPESLPTLVADRVPLQQVFLNLLSNALEHASREAPRVRIHACPLSQGPQGWEFAVEDNGEGIAPEDHERIWGIFQTLRPQTLRPRDRVEGTGIGLAVVRKIVHGRGGRAWVDSQPGKGATFRFTWPENEVAR